MTVDVTPIDVVETGVNRMVWELQEKENHVKFLSLYLKQLQQVEDTLFQILSAGDIELAEGSQLDLIGLIIGVSRNGRADEEYRQSIKFQIIINTSDSTYESIYDAFLSLTSSDYIRIIETGTAFGVVFFSGKQGFNSYSNYLIDQIKATGTNWIVKGDHYTNCLLLNWERSSPALEPFNVTGDGLAYEGLNVTSDGTVYEPFLVGDSSKVTTQDSDRSIFKWEGEPPPSSIKDLRMLSWELTQSNTQPTDDSDIYLLEIYAQHLYDYANFQLPIDLG